MNVDRSVLHKRKGIKFCYVTFLNDCPDPAAHMSENAIPIPMPPIIASLSAMNELQNIAQQVETKTNYLMLLKDGIENMPVIHQIEVLRILYNKQTQINENKNGVFINISKINDKTLQELENYMKYVIQQEEQLNEIEEQKQYLSKEYFDNKTHKDNSL
jgi:hypothetical protein